jgi:general stress protein 26
MTTSSVEPEPIDVPAEVVVKAVTRHSYATLATVSPAGRPHAAGVGYSAVGTTLYVSTDRSSRKARNIAANPHVGLSIPVRRMPFGPPSTVQFQATAELLEPDDRDVVALAASGDLKTVTSHGELERADSCVVRITPGAVVHTYGVGMSLLQFVRDPLNAAGRTRLG